MNVYKLIKKAKDNHLLHQAGWSRNFLDAYIGNEYEWRRVFTKDEYDELKKFHDDMNKALHEIDKERTNRIMNGKATREDIVRVLDYEIYKNKNQWGDDDIYTQWAREHKIAALKAYDNNDKPICVAVISCRYWL